jgi:hypothetical protein
MTEELIKEYLSRHYIEIIGNYKGYKFSKPELDSGVDLSATREVQYEVENSTHYVDSGDSIEFQIKATTDNGIENRDNGFYYDLKAKNFNDLVIRKNRGVIPLVLIVFVLPIDTQEWVNVGDAALLLKKYAFWYYPEDDIELTGNVSTKRIFMPNNNKLDIDFFNCIFQRFFPEDVV